MTAEQLMRLREDGDPTLAMIERALLRIKRRQSRRTLGRAASADAPAPVDIEHIPVIAGLEEAGESPGPVTVGNVAETLGVDPSRASRLVAAAVTAGYVKRVASQEDGRRICLELTGSGRSIAEHAHQYRQLLYQEVLSDWSDEDKRTFAVLLDRFSESLVHEGRDVVPSRVPGQ